MKKSLSGQNVAMLFILSLLLADSCFGFTALPRIKAVEAEPVAKFVNTATGLDFMAVGSSYVNLWWIDGIPHHCNFTPGLYDKQAAEDTLAYMRESGYTVVRTFIDKGHHTRNRLAIYGLDGPYENETPSLYEPYMQNLIDFLERATKHGIYVIAAFEVWPYTRFYSSLVFSGNDDIEGNHNRTILAENTIKAREIYLEEFIKRLKKHNPDLLTTIFAYDVQNELYCRSDQKPFSMTEGLVTTANGKTYDMSCPVSRQACQDENTVNWANRLTAVVKKHDPDALVTASLFPFWPLGKEVEKGLLPLDTPDKRWPVGMRLIIEETDFDFIDIHPYIGWQGNMQEVLDSSQWSEIDKTKKPFVAFEYGAHRFETRVNVDNVELAAQKLYDWRQDMFDIGFAGAAIFTWHTTSHTRWTLTEDGGRINDYMRPCWWWRFDDEKSLERWSFNRNGWFFSTNTVSSLSPIRLGRNFDYEIQSKQSAAVFDFSLTDEPIFIESPWITMNAFQAIALHIKLKNQSDLTDLQVQWLSSEDDKWSQQAAEVFNISANSSQEKVYTINFDKNPQWQGQIRKIRISAGKQAEINSGTIAISEIGFFNRITE